MIGIVPHPVSDRPPVLAAQRETVGEQGTPVFRPQRLFRAIDLLFAGTIAVRPAPDEGHCVVVTGDRRPWGAAKKWTACQQAVVEEEHAIEERFMVIAAELDGGPETVSGTGGLVTLGALRAPIAATTFRHKLAAADPSLIATVRARDADQPIN